MVPTKSRDSLLTTSESPDATPLDADTTGRRFRAAKLLSATLVAALGITLAACSSNANPASTTDSVVQRSGTGNRTITSVNLPKKWSVTWKFDCTNPVSARAFSLSAKNTGGGSPIGITDQTGLGGGGTRVYSQTGTFDFTISTSCSWHLTIGPASSSSGSTTTTTTAP